MEGAALTHLDAAGRATHGRREREGARPTATPAPARWCGCRPPPPPGWPPGDAPKGDVAAVARIAGIQAAKRTDELIPLAHRSR